MQLTLFEITKNLDPILKWVGGKRKLANKIIPHLGLTTSTRLVEPFCGGLAIALSICPKRVLANDVNEYLINFYQHIKDGLNISLEMLNTKEYYDSVKTQFNTGIESNCQNKKRMAEMFYFLNRTGFNGFCRFNRDGYYNVSWGSGGPIEYKRDFSQYHEIFQNWTFSSVDFEKLETEKDDIIYCDPPYFGQYTRYSKEGFNWSDQVRLVDWIRSTNCHCVISNSPNEKIIDLYEKSGFEIHFLTHRTTCSGNGDRPLVSEILAVKKRNSF